MSRFTSEIETDAGPSTKGLLASEVSRKVHQILSQEVVNIFKDTHDFPDENTVQARLIGPLESLWGAKEIYKALQSNPTVANFCGKVFKNGEPAIFCKDCQTDPTCCLCLECFEQSAHKNHNYKMFASGGGGCCDCGDPEAWTDHTYCSIHKPQEMETDHVDPIANLQAPLVDCAKSFLSTVLWYCMTILNWEECRTLPNDVTSTNTQSLLEKDEFIAFLFNDEVHTYDDVITGLSRHIGMTPTAATDLATCVDRRGRGILIRGSEQECLTAQSNINKSLRRSPLGVRIYHSVVVKHQNCAIYLLNFLKELAEKSEGFSRLIAMVVVQPSLSSDNQCLLDRFFVTDNSLWIEARLSWSKLIMCSIYKDFEYKKLLATSLAKNYRTLAKNFMADSHDHDVCAMNLTVQVFTVPSLSRMLVNDHNVLEHVVTTIGDTISHLYDGNKECLNLHSKDYKHDRIAYLLYDLRYLLRNRPEKWTDELRIKTRDGGSVFLNLLSTMENMDAVKRQSGAHVEQEPNWENSFNFSIILTQCIKLFVEWCTSDQKVFVETLNVAVKRLKDIGSKYVFKQHSVDINLVGIRSQKLIMFDIFKDRVSFHHPLARLIAGLLAGGASKYNMSICDLLRIDRNDTQTPLLLIEPCSRSVVLSSQVLGGLWKRNGYSLLNQALHYQLHLSRAVMYDKDIIMLQSMASVMDPNTFLYALLYKFRLENWFTSPANGAREWKEDALRFLVTEIEEFMFLIIVLYGERYQLGIGEGMTQLDAIRRELIHVLYLSPLPHSQIMKKFKMTEDDNAINKLIKEVAVLKKVSGKSVFELKEEHYESYDPFYYHYSKVEQSKGEEVWRKRQKNLRGNTEPNGALPCLPPSFTMPYQGILQLTHSPVLLKILHNVFSEAAKDESKVHSSRLFHQALHLSALILAEEYRQEINTFARKCLGMDDSKHSLLTFLETLQSSSKVEERRQLLVWVVQQLHDVKKEITGCSAPMPMATSQTDETDETDSATPTKKSLIAEEHRKRMMSQISDMQKKFFEDHKQELDLLENANTKDRQTSITSQTGSALLCAVGMASVQSHEQPSATCILCQETADVASNGDKAFVVAVSVQRSSVLRRSETEINKDLNFLNGRFNNKWGIFTGGCGHIMHADCWKKYVDDKEAEQRRRFFFPMRGHTIYWQDGEYLCPFCQTFGNTVLPIALHKPRGTSYMPSRPLSLGDTSKLINSAVKLGRIVTKDTNVYSGSVIEEFNKIIQKLFSKLECDFQPIHLVQSTETPMEYVFIQQTYMQGYAQPPDCCKKTSIAVWKNCLYTITALEHSLREEGKFLLDKLSCRQMDIVYSLIELSSVSCNAIDTKTLSEYANELIINLLPNCSAFSDHPSVLDMDVFSIVGNLRIILSALINRLTVSGSSSDNNLYYSSLIGLIDTCIVSVATAAVIMQYLLCASPGMDVDVQSQDDSMEVDGMDSAEITEGVLLQKLWLKLRSYALDETGMSSFSLSTSETPPSPYSLLVGMQEHLYPFFQSLALFYHSISGIKFVHSSASEASNFSDLCTFLGLPHSLPSLFNDPYIERIAINMCSHSRVANIVRGIEVPRDLVLFKPTRRLIDLPSSYSDLVSKASYFKCPRSAELGGDETQAAMLCLLCGEMICSNSYCCRKTVDDYESVKVGGLTHHSLSCGSGFGVALWILESYIVLINATDCHRVRGCTITPPYIDEYGEPDPGLRRGNPLHFNHENYRTIQSYWLNHQLPEQISKEMEQNMRLLQINWAFM